LKNSGKRSSKLILSMLSSLVFLYILLLIPSPAPPPPPSGEANPFVWNQDNYWSYLESRFLVAREIGRVALADSIYNGLAKIETLLDSCRHVSDGPSSLLLTDIEKSIFELCPFVAVQADQLPALIELRNRLRAIVKNQSRHWDLESAESRDRLYRLLFGARTAIEEVILQTGTDLAPALMICNNEPSVTPSAKISGITIHSGDILVSRGGAPTSGLIARGNDYPGNFSHVALVYVDENTGEVSIIESHIECGVAIASVDKYLKDTKLRILVLRLRADHPAVLANPMLPHEAAGLSLQRARSEHIPYDFEMDFKDNHKLFCSEVASNAYSQMGIQLWMGISNISSAGIRSWLAAFGVKHFITQEPSDLEYDPQLTVVAEWYNPETLYKDHLDNAVIDVMLEGAEQGEQLGYDWYKLPLARVLKGYSFINNLWGGVGPVPEGMDAAAALRNDRFSKRHAAIKARLVQLAGDFQQSRGYHPPYWELVKLARLAKADCGY